MEKVYRTCYAGLAVLSTFPVACFGGLTTVFRANITLLTATIVGATVACYGILKSIDYPQRRAGYIAAILSFGTLTAVILGCLLGCFDDAQTPTARNFFLILTIPLGTVSGTSAYVSGGSVLAYTMSGWVLVCGSAYSSWIWRGYADTLFFLMYGITVTAIVSSASFARSLNIRRNNDEEAGIFWIKLESKENPTTTKPKALPPPPWFGPTFNSLTGFLVSIGLTAVFQKPAANFLPLYATGWLAGTLFLYPVTKNEKSLCYNVSAVVTYFVNAGLTVAVIQMDSSIEYYTESITLLGGVKGLLDSFTFYGLSKTEFDSPPFYFGYGLAMGLNCYVLTMLVFCVTICGGWIC